MNTKKAYCPDPHEHVPEPLYEVRVNGRRLTRGMLVSVERGVNRRAGKYRFEYGEYTRQGDLLLYAEGPLARSRQRRITLRPEHIKTVHSRSVS